MHTNLDKLYFVLFGGDNTNGILVLETEFPNMLIERKESWKLVTDSNGKSKSVKL